MTTRKRGYSLLLVCIFCLFGSGFGSAEEFFVNSVEDAHDLQPGDGLCVAYLVVVPPYVMPFCTLRAAVEETNSLPGEDEIVLSASTYRLAVEGAGEDRAATGDLDISDSVTVSGRGQGETVIDGGRLDRIFDIQGPGNRVNIRDLSLQNGRVATGPGGGAIRNEASLTLSGVVLRDNFADDGSGVSNRGSCRLMNTSVFQNRSDGGATLWNEAGASMRVEQSSLHHNLTGSGACLVNEGEVTLVNSTVSSNSGDRTATPVAIRNRGKMELIQVTVAENGHMAGGVGLQNSGKLTMVNSLVASHAGQDCQLLSPLTSLGGNLDSDGSCTLDQETDQGGADPRLATLDANGGMTWSHPFSFVSPLKDKGVDLSKKGVFTDQRGESRPAGKGYDIGAVEQQFSAIIPCLLPLLL